MQLFNLIACEWLSRKNDGANRKILPRYGVQFNESCYYTIPALQKICKRTESNQRPVALTLHETKPKDIQSI